MAVYHFNVERFQIYNTRAPHEDTDVVSAWVRVNGQLHGPTIVHAGDVNNGIHVVNCKVGPVTASDTDIVAFGFQIVNAGHTDAGAVNAALSTAAETVSLAAIPEPFGAAVAAVTEIIKRIFTINCDGVVALEQHRWPGSRYRELTAGHNPVHFTHTFHGTDSSVGCGSNSVYSVTWSLFREHGA